MIRMINMHFRRQAVVAAGALAQMGLRVYFRSREWARDPSLCSSYWNLNIDHKPFINKIQPCWPLKLFPVSLEESRTLTKIMVVGSDNSTETVLFVCLRVCFYLASLCHLRSVSLSFVETALLLHGTMLRSSSVNLAWGFLKKIIYGWFLLKEDRTLQGRGWVTALF